MALVLPLRREVTWLTLWMSARSRGVASSELEARGDAAGLLGSARSRGVERESMLFVEVEDGECQMVPHFGGEILFDVFPDDVSVCDSENQGDVMDVETYVGLSRFQASMREWSRNPEAFDDGVDDVQEIIADELSDEAAHEARLASLEKFEFTSVLPDFVNVPKDSAPSPVACNEKLASRPRPQRTFSVPDIAPSAGVVVSNAPRDLRMFPNAISEVLYGRYRWWKRRACLAENANQWGKRWGSWRYRVLAARLDNARELKRQQDAAKEKKEK